MMTGNFTYENTISEFLPFSTFNWSRRYILFKTIVFLHNFLLNSNIEKNNTK